MVNVKIAVLLIVASVLVVAIAGVAFAQFAGAHANASRGTGAQYPRGGYYGAYQSPQRGYYPHGGAQNGGRHGIGMGMSMCGHFW